MLSTSSAFPFLLLLLVPSALSQTVLDGCIRLQGSVACPGFSQAWIQASNLSNAFPFFDGVTDVASFDAGALAYFSNPTECWCGVFIFLQGDVTHPHASPQQSGRQNS